MKTDLIEGVSLRKYDIGPAQPPVVFEVAKAGDPVAQDLVRWAGAELGDLALGVIRQLDMLDEKFEIVLSGSFYKGSTEIQTEMERVVHAHVPGAEFVFLKAPSVVGRVLFGAKVAGMSGKNIASTRSKLINHFES